MRNYSATHLSFIILIMSVGFTSCNPDNGTHKTATVKEKKVRDSIQTSSTDSSPGVIDSVNYTDKNGLKQGVWKEYRDGKLYRKSFYKDGLKEGKEIITFGGETHEYTYEKGKKNGINTWRFGNEEYYTTTLYKNDSVVWSVFSGIIVKYVFSVKGHFCKVPSTPIQLYYRSGNLMYEGTITNSDSLYAGTGMHKLYYENGKLKALADYDKSHLQFFNKAGEKIFDGKFKDWDFRSGEEN